MGTVGNRFFKQTVVEYEFATRKLWLICGGNRLDGTPTVDVLPTPRAFVAMTLYSYVACRTQDKAETRYYARVFENAMMERF